MLRVKQLPVPFRRVTFPFEPNVKTHNQKQNKNRNVVGQANPRKRSTNQRKHICEYQVPN